MRAPNYASLIQFYQNVRKFKKSLPTFSPLTGMGPYRTYILDYQNTTTLVLKLRKPTRALFGLRG